MMAANPLYTELTSGPLAAEIAPFIASGDDGLIAAIMNRADIVQKGKLSSHDIRQYFMLKDLLLAIEGNAETSPVCKATVRALEIFPVFDLSIDYILAKFEAMMDGLIADTFVPHFTATDKAILLTMADTTISRAGQLGIRVDVPAIAQALRPS
ncbi:MAG: hypothetical protein PHU14_05755 [Methylovulum sp.]|nr:hypothetical protein [Methylovulum sp.]